MRISARIRGIDECEVGRLWGLFGGVLGLLGDFGKFLKKLGFFESLFLFFRVFCRFF